MLAQLFQPFQQADSSVQRTHGGTGLGLSIAKSLVELWSGRIHAESKPGTRAAGRPPRHAPNPGTCRFPVFIRVHVGGGTGGRCCSRRHIDFSRLQRSRYMAFPASKVASACAGATVLLVDDKDAAGTRAAGILAPWINLVGLRFEFVDSAATADIVAARNRTEASTDEEEEATARLVAMEAGTGPVVAVVLCATLQQIVELQRLQPSGSQRRPLPQIIAHITPRQAH